MTYLAMILLANCTLYGRVEVIPLRQGYAGQVSHGTCQAVILPHETKEVPPMVIPLENNGTVILVDDSMLNDFVEDSGENKNP